MKIGIIVAMDKELNLLLPLISDRITVTLNNFTYHLGSIGDHRVIASTCGIGKVNAAIGALTMIENFHPELIVNTGVAGGTGAGTPPAEILEVVVPDRIAYHDVWCGPGTEPGCAAGCPRYFESPLPDSLISGLGMRRGLLASGDIFVDGKDTLSKILEQYPDAIAVDMESAAIAQTCMLQGVPLVCMRVVSDVPGSGGNAEAYNNFWATAPDRTFHCLLGLLEKIKGMSDLQCAS